MNKPSSFACDLDSLTVEERGRRARLAQALGAAIRDIQELPSGYTLQLESNSEAAVNLEEFVGLEQRCCPFLEFNIRDTQTGEHRFLEVTGAAGVKPFLAGQFGLERSSE